MHPVIGVEFGHDAVQLGRLFLWIAGIRKNDIDQQIALVQGRPAGNGQVAIHAEVDGHGISGDAVAGEALNHGRKCPRVAVITGNEYRGDICLPDGQVANGVELALPPHGAADCHGAEDTSVQPTTRGHRLCVFFGHGPIPSFCSYCTMLGCLEVFWRLFDQYFYSQSVQ